MKKTAALLLVFALILTMFAACTSSGGQTGSSTAPSGEASASSEETPAPSEESPEASSEETPTGGITLTFAQEQVTDEESTAFLETLLAEYEELSGNTIKYEGIPESDYRTWLTTQFTAGTGPAVYTSILHDATSDYNKGWIMNFNELYEAESKYDGGKAWKDTLPESILERMYISPEKDVPGYPTSTSVVRIFCNMDLFRQAGVEQPENWAEFMEACAALKEAEVTPFAFPNATIADLSWLWFNNSVSSQVNSGLLEKVDVSGNGYAELNEMCKAMADGTWDFDVPELKAGYELMKDFSQYWTSDYNSLDRTTAIEMFLRGDAAMIQALSGDLRMIDEMAEFEYAVMPVPVITTDTTEYAQNLSVVLGGQPNTIYSISKSLSDEEQAAAIDFVQWMSSPDVQARYAEAIYRIPLATSVELPEKLAGFIITEDQLRLNYYAGINEQIRNYFHRAGQQYLEGTISVDEMCKILNESYQEVLGQIATENEWTAENNYKIGEE